MGLPGACVKGAHNNSYQTQIIRLKISLLPVYSYNRMSFEEKQGGFLYLDTLYRCKLAHLANLPTWGYPPQLIWYNNSDVGEEILRHTRDSIC